MTDAPATDARIVFVTAPDAETAERLVTAAVEQRLAACGNIVPGVVSLYRWNGVVQRDAEVLVLLKTTAARVEALTARIAALHPYEVPEVLSVGVDAGLPAYLAWVAGSTAEVEEE
ncbi:MAG TPA: divalent-cation tolerance protein CutA [Longimicrobiales bacterium]